ncbi:TatD DNase domain protein [Rhizoctonia solani 123E]|uniref:TatD DNase domain protein n=1 Tax=Rhizoctonia solani 123E TaxID=1423351 RepID=A0A074SC75_9AGAM|nr:TatD DNase domain protein [Rhizoctonia solani 123E]
MKELVAMGFHISVNGCSMKTDQNLATTKAIPLNRLMVETDAPWCSMTSTHSSRAHLNTLPPNLRALYFPQSCQPDKFIEGRAVKGRNESCAVGGVAWVVASLKNCELIDVSRAAWNNTVEMYDLYELMDDEYRGDIATRDAPRDKPVDTNGVVEGAATEVKEEADVDPNEKKIKILKKKLQAIEQLKSRKAQGDKLEVTQVQKILTEPDLLRQLEKLEQS